MYYGIPVSSLPVDSNGNLNFSYHKSWLQQRKIMEREDAVTQRQRTTTAATTASPARNLPAEAPSSAGSQLAFSKLSPRRADQEDDPPHHVARFHHHHPQQPPSSPASSSSSSDDASNTATSSRPTPTKSNKPQAPSLAAGPAGNRKESAPSSSSAVAASDSRRPPPPAPPSLPILQPNPNDCLLGRGKAIDQHVGNCQFRHYIEHHPTLVRAYWNAPKSLKRRIVDQMRMDLQRDLQGLRFLKEQDDGLAWQVADDDAIRHKISRTLRRILQRRQEEQDKLRTAAAAQQQQHQPQQQRQQQQHQQHQPQQHPYFR